MTATIGKHFSPLAPSDKAIASQDMHLNVAYPRCVWQRNEMRPRNPEDQNVFRQWRFGFFVFYAALGLLLGGLAVIADRPGTSTTSAARLSTATASIDTSRHQK